MKGLYCVYEIKGDKPERLIVWLNFKKVKIYDAKTAENAIILTVERKDGKKLFAFCRNMCYNIKKVGYKGKFAPLKVLSERIGLAIGGMLFVALSVLSDGVLFKVDYKGDASAYRKEIETIVEKRSLKIGKSVSGEDAYKLSEDITAIDGVSFASVKMRGHTLYIEAHRETEKPKPLCEKKSEIVSSVKGVVGRINVLSGTALVKEGDEVDKGSVLIDGSYTHGEKQGVTYALGEVEIIAEKVYIYEGVGEDEAIISRATALAKEWAEVEINSLTTSVTEENGKKKCLVKIKYSVWAN